MACPDSALDGALDAESAQWLDRLGPQSPEQGAAVTDLHALLLRVARAEVARRAHRLHIAGAEVDDLAHQAAADALVAITAKLATFRGDSRFTTWAYRFVILEVSTKIGRHHWRRPSVPLGTDDWDRLPDRFGVDPHTAAQSRELIAAVRDAVEHDLTEHQRRIFVALVVEAMPLDALVVELDSNRNAIYKTMFDARRKLRASLVANGYLDDESGRVRRT